MPCGFLNRREFLEKAGWTTGAAALFMTMPDSILLAAENSNSKRLIVATDATEATTFGLAIVNMDTYEVKAVPLTFLAHSFLQQPGEPDHVWAIEKWGKNIAKVDVKSAKIIQHIESPQDTLFYGHGFFWNNGRTIYVTSQDSHLKKGLLIGYDTETFKILTRFQVSSGGLHQCQAINDKIALFANTGTYVTRINSKTDIPEGEHWIEHSSLCHLDVEHEKVVKQIYIDDRDQLACHFSTLDDNIVLLCRPSTHARVHGAVYCGSYNGPLNLVDWGEVGKYTNGEMLSAAIEPSSGLAVVTSGEGGAFMLIDWKHHALIKKFDIFAQGVSYDPELGFVMNGREVMLFHPQKSFDLVGADLITSDRLPYLAKFKSSHNLLI